MCKFQKLQHVQDVLVRIHEGHVDKGMVLAAISNVTDVFVELATGKERDAKQDGE